MTPEEELPSLEKLEGDIERVRGKAAPRPVPARQGGGLALQVGIDLVAGVLVGAAIGVVLDRWLGTSPWLMVICFFLGASGGGLNMARTVKAAQKESERTDDSA